MKILQTAQENPKIVRMSAVALSAAVMAVLWAIVDEYTSIGTPAVIVSSVTSLVMLVAQFVDVRAIGRGEDVFHGEPPE